jgi:ABC-type sugar transport system ATPase subunit
VGARAEIQAIIRRLADEGRGVLMVSSEFEELLWCDRVLVIAEGRVVGQLVDDEITEEGMLRLCYSTP